MSVTPWARCDYCGKTPGNRCDNTRGAHPSRIDRLFEPTEKETKG